MKNTTIPTADNAIKKVFYLPLLWLLTLFLLFAGQFLGIGGSWLLLKAFPALEGNDVWITAGGYLYFWGIWAMLLLWCAVTRKNRPILGVFWKKTRGNTWKRLGLGLAIGFGTNALCAVLAMANGDIHIVFSTFEPVPFVLIFLTVFIQSSAEEAICRAFLYQRLRRAYRSPITAILGSALLFAVLHAWNEGASYLALLSVAVTGILFAVVIYYLDSFWCAAAIHAAWNFTQNILFGLPNSGNVVPWSVFHLDAGNANRTFIYDPGFGIEGAALCILVEGAVAVCIVLWGRRHGAHPTEIWG